VLVAKRDVCQQRIIFCCKPQNIINNFCQWEKEARKIMRRLKMANIIKDLIWMGQVNVKSGTARDEFVKEQAKVIGQGVLPGLSHQGRNID
jgi:hypothetical protein